MSAANPNAVLFTFQMNLEQVNIILESLGKQPYERVADLVNGLRNGALQQLQAAEQAANAANEIQAEVAAEESA